MLKLSRSSDAQPFQSVYLIRISPKGEESFYKIGRTEQDVFQRFLYTDIPSWVRVSESVLMKAEDAVLLESTLHGAFRKQRCIPKIRFGGWTECFYLRPEDVEWVRNVLLQITCPL